MDLDARPYRCFIAIVELGTFHAAADHLHISQPALSAQIRELERRLGFALLRRTSRRVELTAEGRRFLDYARRFVIETDWINQAAREIRTNPLRIATAHHSAQIPERCSLLDRFILAHGDVPLTVTSRTQAQLVADLDTRAADIAITLEPHFPDEVPHAGDEDLAHLDKLVIGTRRVSLLVPIDHPLARHDVIPPEAMIDQEFCSPSRAHGVFLSGILARQLNRFGAKRARVPEGDALAIMRHARLTRLPCFTLGWFPSTAPDMVERAIAGFDMTIDLVVLSARHPLPPAAALFRACASQAASG